MFGFFKAKKVVKQEAVKQDIRTVCALLGQRFWDYELINGREDVVVVKGKYRNHGKDYGRLFMHLMGEFIQFKDERGRLITNIPHQVPSQDMYKQLKNILNVL